MKIPFSPPYIDDDVLKEVKDSLLSGWITTGPKVNALEEEVKQYVDCKACNAVNSWTSGAILSLKWLGVKKDDEVIVPAYTYCATAMAVMDAGAKPVMVDINNDLTIDIEKIKKAITTHTKAILPVDLGGIPCDYKKIRELVESKEIKDMFTPESETQKTLGRIMIISDSAHSIGAKINNENVAQMVDICVLSFHAVKNITSAEGGMICLNLPKPFDNEKLHSWFKIMSLNGQTKDSFSKTQLSSWRYDVVDRGLKINLPDVNAAIALAQIRKYDYLLSERKRVFDRYYNCLKEYSWAVLPFKSNEEIQTAYHLFPLRLNPITEKQRDLLIEYLAKKEIATNVHYIPMPCLTLFKNIGYDIKDYPVAYDTFKREITLPLYPQLTNEQVDYILKNLIEGYNTIIKENN